MRTPFAVLVLMLLAGCSTTNSGSDASTQPGLDPDHFVDAAMVSDFTEESCILSGGTETTCYRFSVSTVPVDHTTGPWCPATILDDATKGGIWPEGGIAYAVDGPFVENLSTFYNDPAWKMYDDSGKIFVTDSPEACAAAARPDVDPQYTNYCVQCLPSYLEDDAQVTYFIPKEPVTVSSTSGTSDPIGVALNGIGFAPAAPTHAILGAYTLAPFDDCGGHVNLNAGYHYHEATGCGTRVAQDDGHASLIGYALDGFAFYDLLDTDGEEPDDLDTCRGHADSTRGYHYHAPSVGTNSFVGCFRAEYGCALEGGGDELTCDATQSIGPPRGRPGGRPGGPPGDLPESASAEDIEHANKHAFATPHEHH